MAILLLFIGCSETRPPSVKINSGLETHYSLILDGQSGSARVRLRQYMEDQGETPEALFLMGFSYHQDKQYIKAVEWLTKSTHAEGRIYAPALHFLGWSYYYLGEKDAARVAFNQFLHLQPDEGDSLFALGLLSTEEGDDARAQQFFQQAIDASDTTVRVQSKAKARLADLYVELDNWDDAILLYEESLRQDPDLYEAWYRLSRVLFRIGQEEKSQEAFKQYELARHRVRPELDVTRFPE